MSDNKLRIRINLQQSTSLETEDPNEQEVLETQHTVDHWDDQEKLPFDWRKITIASTIFIALTGSAAYFFLNNTGTSSLESTNGVLTESDYPVDYSSRFNTFDDIQPSTSADTAVLTAIDAQNDPENVPNVPVPQNKPSSAARTIGPASPRPPTKPTEMAADKHLATSHAPKDNSDIMNESVQSDSNVSMADHPSVIRAHLTHQIRHREPVDELHRIAIEDGKNKSIYFFIELHGLANQYVTVDWYFEDRHMAETKLQIGADQWRTNAKKLLRKQNIGAWKVALHDQMGNALAERHFVVE